MKMGSAEDFDILLFEKKLTGLKDTQESIQSLSTWCLNKRPHHKKIVASWLNVLKRARVEQRLTLFYLANDVIQYSKRKSYEFVESWGTTLQKATPLVRDDKIKHKILRIFRIWEERQIYNDEFLTDLTGLLSVTAGKQASDVDPNDFQPAQLVNKIRQCSVLEADTDQQLKLIHESSIPLNDAPNLCKLLKERRDTDETMKDLDEGIGKLEGYVRALQKELVARAALCRLLPKAHNHYATQRGEVKVVANAYKNFGNRVRVLKRKLDELYEELPNSPVPSPPSLADAVPSPGPDEDLDLPTSNLQETSNQSKLDSSFLENIEKLAGKGFGSFVGKTDFSFSPFKNDKSKSGKAKKIEVISNRPVNKDSSVNIHSLLNSLIPNKPPPSNNEAAYQPLLNPPPPPPPILPGLDLLASTDNIDGSSSSIRSMNKINFYGTGVPPPNITSIPDPNIISDLTWNNSWEMQGIIPVDTPESPPVEHLPTPPPPSIIPVPPPTPDVDHRQLLAPPPVIPQVLLKGDDIDHRRLPPLPPILPLPIPSDGNRAHKADVDHRNLISLTMGNVSVPPPPAPPVGPWAMQGHHTDQDYRSSNEEFSSLVPPPLPPMSIPPPMRRVPAHIDNVESIDMEMSDEENHDAHDDDYNRQMRLETSMARIHGHPPPPIPLHNTPPPFRKQDSMNREKSFTHNRMLIDVSQADKRNNSHQNEKLMQRTNLVCINSSDNYENNKSERNKNPSDKYRHDNYGDDEQSAPINDIFCDFPNNAMNPVNPNVNDPMGSHRESKNDDDWERDEDEGGNRDTWPKQTGPLNPGMSNFPRTRPMYNQRPPQIHNFRRPPPLLNTPTFTEEQYFNPHKNNSRGNTFRRQRGHHRPPRGGYW